MGIVSARQLDHEKNVVVDIRSIPVHNGGSQGAMQARIDRGVDDQRLASQTAARGAPVYEEQELGQRGFYGSQTVISVKDLPAVDASMDPHVQKPKPKQDPRSIEAILARTVPKR